MKLTFLGTGTSQGVPVIGCDCKVCSSMDFRDKRLRSSVIVENETTSVAIDSGPDFRQQMLREHIIKLDALVFTHEHKDHTAGMDDIRAYNFKSGKDMPIYATERVLKQLAKEYEYIFDKNYNYPGVPRIIANEITNNEFRVGDISFLPVKVLHYKLPVFGYRIGKLAYITDANYIPPEEMKKLKNLDVLILNALRIEKHVSHFTLEEAIEVVKELKPKKAYFTHISHYLGKHRDVELKLPDNVEIAYDGLMIEFGL